MINSNHHDDSGDEEHLPAWLAETLRAAQAFTQFTTQLTAQPPEEFRRRSNQAAQVAFIIAKLRDEKAESPFVPMTLGEILDGLARLASVSLAPLITWLGVKDLNALNPEVTEAVVGLARQIGFSLRETLAHIRLGFANTHGTAPMPLLLARYRATDSSQSAIEACESLLARIETKYEHQTLRQLRRSENIIRAKFAE